MHLFESLKSMRFTTTKTNDLICEIGRFCYTDYMKANCDVCPYLESDDELELAARISQNEHWVATLRYGNQALLGTSFITAKRHVESLPELTHEEEVSFVAIRNELITAQCAAFGAAVVNVMCLLNEAYQSNDPSPHVHYHLRPRYRIPVRFNGTTYDDPEFGYYQRRTDTVFTQIAPTKRIVGAIQAHLPPAAT
jgi:diadenosine tetraphosphate (Ap4A) HIT family hydrolase